MDKRSIIGFIIIFVIILVFSKYVFPPPPQQPPSTDQDTSLVQQQPDTTPIQAETIPPETPTIAAVDSAKMAEMKSAELETEKIITIETKNIIFQLSSRGGTLRQVVLKEHVRYDGANVSLMGDYFEPDWTKHGAITIGYRDQIPVFNDLNFKTEGGDLYLNETFPEGSVKFTYYAPDGSFIIKTYSFFYDSYLFDLDINIEMPENLGMREGVTVSWFAPLEPSEKDFRHDRDRLGGFFNGGANFDYRDDLHDGKLREISSGTTDWVATRTKYFSAIIISKDVPGDEVIVVGSEIMRPDPKRKDFKWEQYGIGITYNHPPDNLSLNFEVYTGPNDYDLLKSMGKNLSSLVYMGWNFFRPFAIFIHWIFTSLFSIIPNYGWVIVVFSFLMKIVFWPLSHKSAKSMHKMKLIQPKLQEIKAKYKDDPGRMQKETMAAYKESGVNPFGSCLPMLVQLPIFWAMFAVLSNSIELRGAPFILWITDLSQPDPTGEYLYVGVLPIIMGIAMFIQQKMTITDPKQKMMVYILPVVFTFLFSKWASGLVLYWTVFSIMGIAEQWFVKQRLKEDKAAA
ncbi:MAG: membrane protein insertase YidC [Candidatus Zixiibacteriota bacterium]|nr:MAG: membrane protein insertase YidC [candidate division Zixibacteria bacterium]